jgi:hypothetical protein
MQIILVTATLVSAGIAVVMAAFSWRLFRAEQRRSEARIAWLSAAINDDDDATVVTGPPAGFTPEDEWEFGEKPVSLGSDMFGVAQRAAPSRVRMLGIAAVGALVIGAVVMGLVTIVSASRGTTHAARPTAATPPQTATPAPAVSPVPQAAAPALELIALGHEREKDRLTVRGIVRNPSAGTEMHQLNAVVLLFDHEGGFVATGRAPIDGSNLAPGMERTFVVSVPAGADVERYRVSFRSDDHVVPHVDRRS